MTSLRAFWTLIRFRPWLYAADVVAWIAILLAELGAGTHNMTVGGDTVLLGVLLSAAMGLLGGLLPAIVAVCRRPLEALR